MRGDRTLPPRKRCTGNVRAAPFVLTPGIVRRVIELMPVASGDERACVDKNTEITRLDSSHAAPNNDNGQRGLSPIRRAEIEAEARMRTGVGAAIAREIGRQKTERGAQAVAEPAPAPAIQSVPPEPVLGSRAAASLNGSAAQQVAPAHLEAAPLPKSQDGGDEPTEVAGAQPVPIAVAVAAEVAETSRRRWVARKFGGGVGNPLSASTGRDPDTAFDTHERELRRIDLRPAIKTGEHAERRAVQRAAEEAKARRREMIVAAAEKLRRRRESEVDL